MLHFCRSPSWDALPMEYDIYFGICPPLGLYEIGDAKLSIIT